MFSNLINLPIIDDVAIRIYKSNVQIAIVLELPLDDAAKVAEDHPAEAVWPPELVDLAVVPACFEVHLLNRVLRLNGVHLALVHQGSDVEPTGFAPVRKHLLRFDIWSLDEQGLHLHLYWYFGNIVWSAGVSWLRDLYNHWTCGVRFDGDGGWIHSSTSCAISIIGGCAVVASDVGVDNLFVLPGNIALRQSLGQYVVVRSQKQLLPVQEVILLPKKLCLGELLLGPSRVHVNISLLHLHNSLELLDLLGHGLAVHEVGTEQEVVVSCQLSLESFVLNL